MTGRPRRGDEDWQTRTIASKKTGAADPTLRATLATTLEPRFHPGALPHRRPNPSHRDRSACLLPVSARIPFLLDLSPPHRTHDESTADAACAHADNCRGGGYAWKPAERVRDDSWVVFLLTRTGTLALWRGDCQMRNAVRNNTGLPHHLERRAHGISQTMMAWGGHGPSMTHHPLRIVAKDRHWKR